METIFKIEKNKNNQKVLMVDDDFRIFKHAPVNYDEFDAVMFLSENGNLVNQQFLHLNILIDKSFYLKPFFLNPNVANTSFLKCAADGLSSDLEDPLVMTKIDDIAQLIKNLNIEMGDAELKSDEKTVLISLFRFYLSRGGIPDAVLMEGSTLGYCVCLYEFFIKNDTLSFQAVLMIYEEYIKNKYIKCLDLIDVVQYCKHCNHTHVIYTEICPKCDSCNIELSNMMHHYPCANISDEKSYMTNGDLVCPKCKKHLHHIGVDYDRPAGIYNCDSCNANFSRSNMKGTCVSCKKVLSLEELRLYKICSIEFTPLGKDKIAQYTIYNSNKDMAASEGLLSINIFIEYITNEIEIYKLSTKKNKLTTIIVQGISLSKVGELSLFIFENISNAKCTFKSNTIYISLTYTDESTIENYAKLLDKQMQKMNIEEYIGIDYANYTTAISTSNYLKQLF